MMGNGGDRHCALKGRDARRGRKCWNGVSRNEENCIVYQRIGVYGDGQCRVRLFCISGLVHERVDKLSCVLKGWM